MYQVSRHVDPSEPKSDRVGSFYDLLLFLFVFSCYFVFILFLLPRIIQTLANGEGFHATFSRCLPNFTEFCKGFTEFYRVLQGFYRILSCFIEFYKGFTNLPSFTGFLISNTVTSLDPFFCEVHHFAKKNGYRVFHWVSASLLRAFPCERNDILEIRWTIAIQFLISNTVTSLDPFFCEVHHFAKKNGYRVFHWVSASLLRAFPCERNDILEIRWTIAIQSRKNKQRSEKAKNRDRPPLQRTVSAFHSNSNRLLTIPLLSN